MIGYEMGFSPALVYTTSKTSPVENFKFEWKNDMDANITIFFTRGVLQRPSFLDNSNPPHIVWPNVCKGEGYTHRDNRGWWQGPMKYLEWQWCHLTHLAQAMGGNMSTAMNLAHVLCKCVMRPVCSVLWSKSWNCITSDPWKKNMVMF